MPTPVEPIAPEPGHRLDVEVERIAVGGPSIARHPDGRILLVDGAWPGETVTVELTEVHVRRLEGHAVAIGSPSPHRRPPHCPQVEAGCGGCGWQHGEPAAQVAWKVDQVRDALRRQGRVDPDGLVQGVTAGPPLPPGGRTTVRLGVDANGRLGYRAVRSHDVITTDRCPAAHPAIDDVLGSIRLPGADEVTLRTDRSGSRIIAIVAPSIPEDAEIPAGVEAVGADELADGQRVWWTDEVAGHQFRVSADSFFQTRPDGADQLVEAVRSAVGDAADGERLVDLYSGVGLLAATVGRPAEVTAVEASRSSVADARHNLERLTDRTAKVVRSRVERFRPHAAAAVVADPARAGLGRDAVSVIKRIGPARLALVSCDVGSLGRDVALVESAGFGLVGCHLVDMFPDTPRVEVVSRFDAR